MKHKPYESDGKLPKTSERLLWLLLLPALSVLLLAGCKHGTNATTEVNPAGTYALVSVDGNQVPCTVEHDGHKLAIKSGMFIINADGTCSSKMLFSPPSGAEVTREVKATYTREGTKLTMKWEQAGTTLGTIQGNTFTMNNEGMVLAYRK